MGGQTQAIQAGRYANAARSNEQRGDLDGARHWYLESAQVYIAAIKAGGSPQEISSWRSYAELYTTKASNLRQPRRIASNGSSTGEQEENADLSRFEPQKIDKPVFDDIGGLLDLKKDLRRAIIEPLRRPEVFEQYGRQAGDSLLMYGPPGCGKTYIASAAAAEASKLGLEVKFLEITISNVLSKWVGEAEQHVTYACNRAKECAPCVVFLDEIDALGGRRTGSDDEKWAKRLVNVFLTELTAGAKSKVLWIAATNQPWLVDPALRRPGRFNKLVYVPLPNESAREAIFKLHTKSIKSIDNIDFANLTQQTDGYSGADIESICRRATDIPLEAALEGKPARNVTCDDFNTAINATPRSTVPWFRLAKSEVMKSGEGELFRALLADAEKYGMVT